jgi:hypothetical protein
MLGECGVVCYGVKCGWVEFGEGGVCVLAVEALLKAIDPELLAGTVKEEG